MKLRKKIKEEEEKGATETGVTGPRKTVEGAFVRGSNARPARFKTQVCQEGGTVVKPVWTGSQKARRKVSG